MGGVSIGGPVQPGPSPCTSLHVPDLKCDFERVPDFNVLVKQFPFVLLIIIPIFLRTVLCVRSFFGTMGSFLIIPFVLANERSGPRNDVQF